MGLFNTLFNSGSEAEKDSKLNWIQLSEITQLETMISQSKIKPILLFKYSTSCGISRMALKRFEREFNLPEGVIDLYFLDLLNFRAISNEIASKFNVSHQSPQVILVKDGEVIYHNSHYSICANKIKEIVG